MAGDGRKAGFSPRTLAAMRKRLELSRRALITDLGITEDELRWIAEDRESELEERSQEEAAAEVLARLEEHDYERVREVLDALDRIADGIYGACLGCGRRIPLERLRALPAATLCARCAAETERPWHAAGGEAGETTGPAGEAVLPPELSGMSDVEIVSLVREQFGTEVGEALAPVRVLCRHGRVTLAGEVASEELRQTAVRIVEEEVGLETADRIRVTGFAGERPAEPERFTMMPAARETPNDIFDVDEEGGDYTPPATPTAETE